MIVDVYCLKNFGCACVRKKSITYENNDSSKLRACSQVYYKSLEWRYLGPDLGLLVYYSAKTTRHRQNGLSYVPKKILTWMLRKATGGLKTTVGNRVKPDYHFFSIVFRSFLFLSARFLCSLAGYAQKHVSTYWTLWIWARLRFEEHI